MNGWLKDAFARLRAPSDRRLRWLVGLGLAGMLLVGISEWLPQDTHAVGQTTVSAAELETALEERVTALLSRVDGVGECYVMVTLEQGVQQVYAADTAADSTEVVVVATEQGPIGLAVSQIQPVVKGVAVVCDGGKDAAVRQRVTDLITAVLHVASYRVCVVADQ